MKTVFDKSTRDELIERVSQINAGSTAHWGKMNVVQMLKHCIKCEELYQGKIKEKRVFMGYIFGRIGLRNMLKDDKPMPKNSPTNTAFKIADTSGDAEAEKKKWIALLEDYVNYSNDDFVHWFFGKMTREQVGKFVYKHSDHHLRQFNC